MTSSFCGIKIIEDFQEEMTCVKERFNDICYSPIIDCLTENNTFYLIKNCVLYSVLLIPDYNYKIYNYYISNYYMFYKNDKFIFQIHGIHLCDQNFEQNLKLLMKM
jgi:hypothetical protein